MFEFETTGESIYTWTDTTLLKPFANAYHGDLCSGCTTRKALGNVTRDRPTVAINDAKTNTDTDTDTDGTEPYPFV